MRRLVQVLVALLCVAPMVMAYDATDAAYLRGVEDGYTLGRASIQGQSDANAEALYNGLVDDINARLDQVGYTGGRFGHLPVNDHQLPPIFSGTMPPMTQATGIEHKIDGKGPSAGVILTDDINDLSDAARYNQTSGKYTDLGGPWLPGV